MLRLMTTGAPIALTSGALRPAPRHRTAGPLIHRAILATAVLFGTALAGQDAIAQNGKIGPAAPVSYDNHYEVYGGLNYMNFQAGQNLPKLMNLGGVEVSLTDWLKPRLGVTADYRGEAGTTFASPSPGTFNPSRQLVYMNMGMLGATYRGPKNHYAAVDYHALVGVDHGVFTGPGYDVGLYHNSTKPIGAFGGSLDYNRSKNIAIRLSPDLIIEHFGSEYREFFAISGGVIYRFGQRSTAGPSVPKARRTGLRSFGCSGFRDTGR